MDCITLFRKLNLVCINIILLNCRTFRFAEQDQISVYVFFRILRNDIPQILITGRSACSAVPHIPQFSMYQNYVNIIARILKASKLRSY